MSKYRVVSNGLNYRIQRLGKTLILRRLKWYWLWSHNYAGGYIAEFTNEKEAQSAMETHIKEIKAKKQGYIPV